MSPEPPTEVILPARGRRPEREVYGFALGISLWSFVVTEYYFSLWAGASTARFILTFLLVPVTCFVALLVLVQVALWVALIPTRALRLGREQYDRIASILVLGGLSMVALGLMAELEPTAHFLGWVWWAGLILAMLVHGVGKATMEPVASQSLELKPEN